MTLALLICSLCGMELSEEQVEQSRAVVLPQSGDLIAVCPTCDDFYDRGLPGELLEFLANVKAN